ncbi:conserved unknown protein [Ectocarpus siliculosus]|uniref:LNS2/PITP domain-containing protein n=1 Tax=Ectocarpus siliculosus TaxID=2880 RepID=D8LKT7_ECTSI|nr:conserved unknown protein [Ectocarpus siliculosus]|eukprot:CBN80070.1 conserved unknown protein [Ectocarpus siliculosus]
MLAKDDTLVDGFNTVRFEIRYLRDPRVLVAECFAFVWDVNTPMIVVDIDGTITRSDVSGLMMTLSPGLVTNHTHEGICSLLARMVDEAGAQVVYLTSRPISLAAKTRTFLASTEQEGKRLPLGPLQCCLEKVSGVLWRELVSKNMHDYKITALLDLARPFREAGRTFGEAVFAAGIGNRVHDAVAYRAAGIPKDFIFLIDTESNLRVWDGDTSKMGGSRANSPISPKKKKKLPDKQEQQEEEGEGKSPKTNTPTDSRRKRHTAAALKEAASRQQFGEDEEDSDDEGYDDDEGTAAGGDGGRHADGSAVQEQRLPTMAEDSSWAGTDPQPWSSSSGGDSGGDGESRGEGPGGVNDTGEETQAMTGERKGGEEEVKAEGKAAAAAEAKEGNLDGPPQHQEPAAGAAAGSSLSLPPASSAPVDYQSYGDARFFDRLRASLDHAAWEAQKAVEAAAHATHAGVQAGVHAAGSALSSGRRVGVEGGEDGEGAADRLAERVQEMSHRDLPE